MTKFEKCSLLLQGIGTLLIVISIIYAASQFNLSKGQGDRVIAKETMEFMGALVIDLDKELTYLKAKPLTNEISVSQIRVIKNIGNRLQYMCYQMNMGIFDEEVVNYFYGRNLSSIYKPVKEIVVKLQSQDKTMWPDLAKCSMKWS
jgi:hypothetical protein